MEIRTILVFFLACASPALPCTCVSATNYNPANDAALVFRGIVVERRTLPRRAELHRGRYAITFQIDEYWKGDPGRTVIIYGLDSGTDCLGGSSYEIGKSYLVYAAEQEVKDVVINGFFWYGWTDLLPESTKMLVPQPCAPGGETALVKKAIHQLGKGRTPPHPK